MTFPQTAVAMGRAERSSDPQKQDEKRAIEREREREKRGEEKSGI